MTKELAKLRKANPNYLGIDQTQPTNPLNAVAHFIFTVVDLADPISMPVCGEINAAHIKNKIHQVNCPDCLAALEVYAGADKYDQALAHATTLAPKFKITPDPEIMKQKHGSQPSIEAARHMKAKRILDLKGASKPSDLPLRMIGGIPRTFYKNMFEIGLITEDGDRTGLSAQDVANGMLPDDAGKITVD